MFTYVIFTTSTPVVFARSIPWDSVRKHHLRNPLELVWSLIIIFLLKVLVPFLRVETLKEDVLYEILSENVHAYHLGDLPRILHD